MAEQKRRRNSVDSSPTRLEAPHPISAEKGPKKTGSIKKLSKGIKKEIKLIGKEIVHTKNLIPLLRTKKPHEDSAAKHATISIHDFPPSVPASPFGPHEKPPQTQSRARFLASTAPGEYGTTFSRTAASVPSSPVHSHSSSASSGQLSADELSLLRKMPDRFLLHPARKALTKSGERMSLNEDMLESEESTDAAAVLPPPAPPPPPKLLTKEASLSRGFSLQNILRSPLLSKHHSSRPNTPSSPLASTSSPSSPSSAASPAPVEEPFASNIPTPPPRPPIFVPPRESFLSRAFSRPKHRLARNTSFPLNSVPSASTPSSPSSSPYYNEVSDPSQGHTSRIRSILRKSPHLSTSGGSQPSSSSSEPSDVMQSINSPAKTFSRPGLRSSGNYPAASAPSSAASSPTVHKREGAGENVSFFPPSFHSPSSPTSSSSSDSVPPPALSISISEPQLSQSKPSPPVRVMRTFSIVRSKMKFNEADVLSSLSRLDKALDVMSLQIRMITPDTNRIRSLMETKKAKKEENAHSVLVSLRRAQKKNESILRSLNTFDFTAELANRSSKLEITERGIDSLEKGRLQSYAEEVLSWTVFFLVSG